MQQNSNNNNNKKFIISFLNFLQPYQIFN